MTRSPGLGISPLPILASLYWIPLSVNVKSGPAFIRALLLSRYDASPAATGGWGGVATEWQGWQRGGGGLAACPAATVIDELTWAPAVSGAAMKAVAILAPRLSWWRRVQRAAWSLVKAITGPRGALVRPEAVPTTALSAISALDILSMGATSQVRWVGYSNAPPWFFRHVRKQVESVVLVVRLKIFEQCRAPCFEPRRPSTRGGRKVPTELSANGLRRNGEQ